MLSCGIAFLVILEDDEGLPVGAAGVCVAPSTYWDFWMASETFWYVEPPHRKGTFPIRMLKAAEVEAARRGCKVMAAGHKVFWNAEKMARLYKARGYRPHDLIYVKEI
jgi:GNAT superfamily N-acetyltransferase